MLIVPWAIIDIGIVAEENTEKINITCHRVMQYFEMNIASIFIMW